MLDLDPGVMIWAWITFVILLLLLFKFAWKPILSTIEKREKTIQDSLDQAEKAQTDAQELLVKHEELMKQAGEEAQRLIRENRELAEKSRQDIIAEARSSADGILEKAKTEIEKEKDNALQALRGEIADLTISATKKIIGESLDESKHRSLIDEFIQKIPGSTKN